MKGQDGKQDFKAGRMWEKEKFAVLITPYFVIGEVQRCGSHL